MKPSERMTAFFGAMLVTFGITGLDFENPEFKYNQVEYIVLFLGLVLLIAYFIIRRNKIDVK